MNKSLHSLAVLLLGLTLHTSLQAAATDWKVNAHGQVRLIAAENGASTQGPLLLGFQFKTAPGWYVYWKVAGDAGYPPRVSWEGSQGMKNPQFLWPAPTKFVLPGNIVEYGYQGEVVYPVQAERSGRATVHLKATISYLTCNTSCVPYKYAFDLALPSKDTGKEGDLRGLIERFLAQVPEARLSDQAILKQATTQIKNPFLTPESTGASAPPLSILSLLLLAFVGGLILNIMPCVLPVLAIKLLGLVKQSGHAHTTIARNSLLSAAGIITSFLALGGVAVAANASGRAVGWGIQFQNPIFVMGLAIVVFLFALNLWGFFEIGMPRLFGHFATTYGQRETPAAHFMSGLFATLLATPCSAPFLGTAMGFALTQPGRIVMMAFAAAGAGMALPYFLLAAWPGSLHWLPKPGAWMGTVKRVFSLLLAITTVWLLWVFVQLVRPTTQERFDESRIQTYLAEGTPVLVDVTADWCVTCKYNERFVLDSAAVKRALVERRVVIMRADWTNRDETIRQYLAKFGRSGIPFYAYYAPGKEPVTLSEFLTPSQVLDVLKN